MNIGVITHNFPASKNDRQNAGIFVYDLAQELSKKNNTRVYCCGQSDSVEKIEGLQVHRFKWNGRKLGDLKIWNLFDLVSLFSFFNSGAKGLERFYKKDNLDVTLAMWAFPAGLFAYFLKKRFKVPYGVWALGSDIYIYTKKPFLNILIKKILREADFLVADGIDLANEVEKISGKKCVFIPSSSKLSSKLTKTLKKNTKKIVLSFLGRMEEVKGPDVLVEALLKIKGLEEFEIHMMGDGSLLQSLRERVLKNGKEKYFKFYGNVHDPRVITKVLSISDWLIIPSRSDSIPLTFSESMKAQTPVISSDLADLKYLIKKYQVGFNFRTGSVNELYKILNKLPQMKSSRKNFVENTKKVAKIFTIEQSGKDLIKVISQTI